MQSRLCAFSINSNSITRFTAMWRWQKWYSWKQFSVQSPHPPVQNIPQMQIEKVCLSLLSITKPEVYWFMPLYASTHIQFNLYVRQICDKIKRIDIQKYTIIAHHAHVIPWLIIHARRKWNRKDSCLVDWGRWKWIANGTKISVWVWALCACVWCVVSQKNLLSSYVRCWAENVRGRNRPRRAAGKGKSRSRNSTLSCGVTLRPYIHKWMKMNGNGWRRNKWGRERETAREREGNQEGVRKKIWAIVFERGGGVGLDGSDLNWVICRLSGPGRWLRTIRWAQAPSRS